MGVSIYPAQGGDGFKLRKIITTTGLQDLGQARNCYVVVAGGGGGGSGCLSGQSWSGSGGGGAGAVGGSILLKEFHATIGAGGTAGSIDTDGGNGGTTYLTMYGSLASQNVTSGQLSGWYIVCLGGQGGSINGAAIDYTGSFENAGNPTISGWGFFTKMFGSSGAGGGYLGSSNNTSGSQSINYSSSLNTVEGLSLVGWTPNQLSMFNGQGAAATLVAHSNYGGGWAGIDARPKEPALNNAAQNTTGLPLYTWTRTTSPSPFIFASAGASASNGGPGRAGGSGYWTGGGGSGDTQGASQRGPQGGSSKAFRGGLGGAAGSGANGGAGGGAGIVANGGNGGGASGSTSGISGVGGLGGGGGAGGNRTGTQRAGGAGGAGAIAIYW